MEIFMCFLPVCPTHGLWSPDEDVFFSSVSTDGVRVVIGKLGVLGEAPVIVRSVDQHSIHHFLFVQGGLEHSQDGWSTEAKLETNKQVSVEGTPRRDVTSAQLRALCWCQTVS